MTISAFKDVPDRFELNVSRSSNRIMRGIKMRIIGGVEKIDTKEVKDFFNKRAEKYDSLENPYSVTMFRDKDSDFIDKENERERSKLLPLLELNSESTVLDLACGIGRWADFIDLPIKEYCGVDFSDELIEIAKRRVTKPEHYFYSGDLTELESVLKANNKGSYNKVLLFGILLYVNDKDLDTILEQTEKRCDEHALICIRVSIAHTDRLTLKDFYSNELDDNYNVIYRTDAEMRSFFERKLEPKGFTLVESGPMFEENDLNTRKETKQYYYILKR